MNCKGFSRENQFTVAESASTLDWFDGADGIPPSPRRFQFWPWCSSFLPLAAHLLRRIRANCENKRKQLKAKLRLRKRKRRMPLKRNGLPKGTLWLLKIERQPNADGRNNGRRKPSGIYMSQGSFP